MISTGFTTEHGRGAAAAQAPASSDWRSYGACLTADPDLFFPISSTGPAQRQISQAKAVCGRCQVQQQCLSFALETQQVHGVWGGMSAEERQLFRRGSVRRPGHAA